MLMAFQLPVFRALAAEDGTAAEKACEASKPDFDALWKEWVELDPKLDPKNANTYKEHFEKAKTAYHEYAQCMFDSAEMILLKSDASEPDFPWNDPGKACLTDDERKKLIKSTDFGAIAAVLQQVHRNYSNYLRALEINYRKVGKVTNKEGKPLRGLQSYEKKIKEAKAFDILTRSELDNALLAIDMTFISLRELRLALIMHIHFQCMMKNLEKFRSYLESLRIIIDLLPSQLKDASMSQ